MTSRNQSRTLGVNIINVLLAAFMRADPKSAKKTTKSQFHQHFMRAFFVRKQIEQLLSNYVWLCDFLHQNFVRKTHT